MRSMLTALFILLALIGSTATAKPLPANLDARMFVNGTVTVSEAGRVLDHRIDTEVDAQIRELIDGAVSRWLFEPIEVDGEIVQFTSDVRITLHGLTTGSEGELIVRVEDVVFTGTRRNGINALEHDTSISYRKIIRPAYPGNMGLRGVQGETAVALRIGRDGKVIDKAILYTDLVGTSNSESELASARKAFEKSALRVVGHWTFNVRPDAFKPGEDDTTVLVPLAYSMRGSERRWLTPGHWNIITRGQRQRAEWLDKDELAAQFSEDGSGTSWPVRLMTQPDGTPL
jgi:hypothetical protein